MHVVTAMMLPLQPQVYHHFTFRYHCRRYGQTPTFSMILPTILAPSSSKSELPIATPSSCFLNVNAIPPPIMMASREALSGTLDCCSVSIGTKTFHPTPPRCFAFCAIADFGPNVVLWKSGEAYILVMTEYSFTGIKIYRARGLFLSVSVRLTDDRPITG